MLNNNLHLSSQASDASEDNASSGAKSTIGNIKLTIGITNGSEITHEFPFVGANDTFKTMQLVHSFSNVEYIHYTDEAEKCSRFHRFLFTSCNVTSVNGIYEGEFMSIFEFIQSINS